MRLACRIELCDGRLMGVKNSNGSLEVSYIGSYINIVVKL